MEEVKEKKENKKYGKFEDYEIESAARTIQEAEEIKADPEKMKYVAMCLKDKCKAAEKAVKSIKSIKDIKDAGNEYDEEKDA
jgi:hypothetical protein